MTQWPARDTGSVQSPPLWNGLPLLNSPTTSIGSVVKRNLEKEGSDTTRCLWRSAGISGCMDSDCCSPDTGNLPDLLLPKNMSGKKTPGSPERSSSSELGPSNETRKWIGPKCDELQSQEISPPSPRMCTLNITILCEELLLTMLGRWLASGLAMSSGARLVLVSLGVLGKKRRYKLTVKTLCQSGGKTKLTVGVDMLESAMSLSTSFGVFSLLRTSFDGSTAIQSEWREKEPLMLSAQRPFGSPRI